MNILMLLTLSLVVFCSLIFSGGQDRERNNYIWEMEASDGLELFGNDGSGAGFHLTDEFSYNGDRSVKVIASGASNEPKISLPVRNTLTD